jgi:ubiquitin thioesterase protein OTUB1
MSGVRGVSLSVPLLSFDNTNASSGDGDCFYRCEASSSISWRKLTTGTYLALGFAYVESLINSKERDFAVGSSLSILESTKDTLDNAGIQKMVYEDFYEDFEALIQNITKPDKYGRPLNTELLLSAFQQPEGDSLGHLSSRC